MQWYLTRQGITDIDAESISFKVEGPAINRIKKKRMGNWPQPMSARSGQGEGISSNNWQEDADRRSATNIGSVKKDDDISVLLEEP